MRKLCAGVLLIGTFAAACEVTPDGRFVMMPDPALFGVAAGSASSKDGQKGSVSMTLPAAVTLGISSLEDKSAREFKGREAKSLLSLIGRPDFVRRDGPAQIWQYRANACIFDLFVYGNTTDKMVQHAEVRGNGVGKPPARGCFARLLQGRVANKHALAPFKESSL